MASVPAEEEVPEAPRSRRLLPNVRPVTTLLATGVVWITGLLVACCLAGGYLRHQVLNTTADELRRLDAVLAEATTRSLQGIEPILERLADRLPGSSDISAAAPRSDAAALENAGLLQQVIEHSGQIDAIARIGPEGKVLGTVGAWPANLAEIADKNYFTGRAAPSSRARFVGAPIEDVQAGTFRLPVAQLILGEGGTPAGGIVALVPLAKLTASFETAPLADDTRIAVIGPDGRVLARISGGDAHVREREAADAGGLQPQHEALVGDQEADAGGVLRAVAPLHRRRAHAASAGARLDDDAARGGT